MAHYFVVQRNRFGYEFSALCTEYPPERRDGTVQEYISIIPVDECWSFAALRGFYDMKSLEGNIMEEPNGNN